ncbi:hypothetical protein RN001_014390 [Aquatica leii]|uniref:Uncharacterized protein n=1 Tax=Aquatica leii TaxID=1421715 RepID=A0AAN7P1V0_9COLE|nr:hypothetical protein RN001_014390 [Aquatica leii]
MDGNKAEAKTIGGILELELEKGKTNVKFKNGLKFGDSSPKPNVKNSNQILITAIICYATLASKKKSMS